MHNILVIVAIVGSVQLVTSQERQLLNTVGSFRSYGHVYDSNNIEAMRPRVMGTRGAIASGHYLSTLAGIEAFKKGGNAFDAGVSAAMALKVMKMGYAGWTGVAPLILYSARDQEVLTRVGAGWSPSAATLEHFQEKGKTPINNALIPADVDVWLAALAKYGSFSFEEAVKPALAIAEEGYHLYKHQKGLLDLQEEQIKRYPYNVSFWYPNGLGRQRLGDRMLNKDLGKLMRYMISAETKVLANGGSRISGIVAARDAFYKGEPARAVARLYQEAKGGLVNYSDLSEYQGKWMKPLQVEFFGYDIYVCDGWSQGPRLLLFLNMLDNFDLESLGYNTADYIHVLSQVISLGMADSHKYIGDPDFTEIPESLYSKSYGKTRAVLVNLDEAFSDMPPWGDPANMRGVASDSPSHFGSLDLDNGSQVFQDTTSLNVIDGDGNVFSMTESDGHMTTPMVPGWGFGLGGRMYQFNLDPALANVIAPRKRPRNTNNPVLIMKEGKPFMGLSTPGGDQQAQAILQVLLNVVVWGMSPEHAVDQPRFGTYNFPPTGSEINSTPGVLRVESRIPEGTFEALRSKGHKIETWGPWNWATGALTVTYRDPETGLLVAAGDVRRETAALAY